MRRLIGHRREALGELGGLVGVILRGALDLDIFLVAGRERHADWDLSPGRRRRPGSRPAAPGCCAARSLRVPWRSTCRTTIATATSVATNSAQARRARSSRCAGRRESTSWACGLSGRCRSRSGDIAHGAMDHESALHLAVVADAEQVERVARRIRDPAVRPRCAARNAATKSGEKAACLGQPGS